MQASPTKYKRWKRESQPIGDMIEEIDTSVKENVKYKKVPDTKYPRNLRHYEKAKPTNNTRRKCPQLQGPENISTKSLKKISQT